MNPQPAIFDTAPRPLRANSDGFLRVQLEMRALEKLEALTNAPATLALLDARPGFAHDVQLLFPHTVITYAHIAHQNGLDRLIVEGNPAAIIDTGALAVVNDVPGVLHQIYQALQPNGAHGGVFMATLFGGASLQELRAALLAAETALAGGTSPRIHPMLDLAGATALLQRAGFQLPVADHEVMEVSYGNMGRLAGDLRGSQMTSRLTARPRTMPHRGLFAVAEAHMFENAPAPHGRFKATFDIISMTGWRNA